MPAEASGNGIAVLGGTFNPLHVGHMRLAIEAHEALGGLVSRVDLLPCAHPPHKESIGGHVAAMETSMETLKREFEEELHKQRYPFLRYPDGTHPGGRSSLALAFLQ